MTVLSRNTFSDYDQFFNVLASNIAPRTRRKTTSDYESNQLPKTDITETTTAFKLTAELPGISKEDINITVDESVLLIESQQNAEQSKNKDETSIRTERLTGNYSRKFTLNDSIDQQAISAEFKNGLLILTLPKLKEEIQQPKKIDIH